VNRDGDMTPQMMVLGLACEEAGTVADIQRRLADLFVSADFPKNAAHTNLPALAAKGYVRLVEEGEEPSQNRYEGTENGIRRLRDWVVSRPPVPAMRETIHGKVEFATLDELAELIILVRAEAKACQITSDHAHERMLTEQRRRIRMQPKGWAEQLDAELSTAHLIDVKMGWDDVAARRRKLADRLERIYRHFAGQAM
jgi:DNA-binding PadR family transcriptional regulator